jgi:hypothetical protein
MMTGLTQPQSGRICDESDNANDRGKSAQATRMADEDASLSSLLLYRDPVSDVVPAVLYAESHKNI